MEILSKFKNNIEATEEYRARQKLLRIERTQQEDRETRQKAIEALKQENEALEQKIEALRQEVDALNRENEATRLFLLNLEIDPNPLRSQ